MKKETKVKMSKPIYLVMSILGISKTPMYEFWCNYIKPKYQDRAKICWYWRWKKILLMTLKNGFTHKITAKMIIDHFQ